MQGLGSDFDRGKPAILVIFYARQQFFFQFVEELLHKFEIVVLAVALVYLEIEMSFYIGFLELFIVGIRLGEVVYYLCSAK